MPKPTPMTPNSRIPPQPSMFYNTRSRPRIHVMHAGFLRACEGYHTHYNRTCMRVESAHKAGILHRDLKPENILLPESGTGPKVVDFGVAKLSTNPTGGGTMAGAGTIVGTPAYMAPEQLRGEGVDGRADVFSLGVMTFEMLTGAVAFANELKRITKGE
ncbi:MAG: hypothetical protein EXQ50_07155 [Acidobacteria bacterium]|nr:hypothetical protein [Acidobacteriota bacterium]MSO61852.1 hypothetical protein [Acidobacteriota bacterium]